MRSGSDCFPALHTLIVRLALRRRSEAREGDGNWTIVSGAYREPETGLSLPPHWWLSELLMTDDLCTHILMPCTSHVRD